MVCTPCKEDDHDSCVELKRQRRIRRTWTAIVAGAIVRAMALTTGQHCDCHHEPRS